MPARAIDPLPERLAIARIREPSARIETLQPDASAPRGRGLHHFNRHEVRLFHQGREERFI
jgi:hypothetical protein